MQRSIIAPAERVTNLRWGMLALVAVLVLALSADATSLVLGGWTALDRIAFVTGLIVAQLPVGFALDRYGVRRTGSVAAVVWILASAGVALAGGAATVVAGALAGAAASVILPLAVKATASWFPRAERGVATAIVAAAANAPIVFTFSPFAPHDGGPGTALLPLALAAVATALFAFVYRDADDPRVTYAERTYIAEGGAQPVVVGPATRTLLHLVRQPAVWAIAIAFGAFSYAFGVGATQLWSVPFGGLALLVNVAIGGLLVDALARRGATHIRTTVFGLGALCGCAAAGVFGASPGTGLIFATIALIGFAAAQPVAWSIPGFIAPPGAVGIVAAIVGLAGSLGATAVWLGGTDARGAAFAAMTATAVYVIGLQRIEPISDPV